MPDLIDRSLAQRILSAALERGGDHADVFCESTVGRSVSYEEGRVKSASESRRLGAGVRVVVGEQSGYACCDGLEPEDLLRAARLAAAIAHGGGRAVPAFATPALRSHPVAIPLAGDDLGWRIGMCRRAHDRAAGRDPRVRWVQVGLADATTQVTIAAATASGEAVFASDLRPMLRMNVVATVADGQRREQATSGGGGRQGREYLDRVTPEHHADEAVRQALAMLSAIDAPAGAMPVVLAPATSGILIHEAVGHGLEGDFNRKGVSTFAGQLGKRVASDLVTVVDDPGPDGDRGALNIDDEGVVPQRATLIERGVLTGYLHDRTSARLMGLPALGNGRREDYRCQPMPRMRVTYLAAGQDDPADILRSVKRGIYCVNFRGGSVDIAKGDFNFNVSEGYLIEDGRIGPALKGATLIGNGPEAMRRVERVGHDLRLSDGMWTCGKDGQGAPVGQGLPTTLVSEMTVGGRS